MLPDTPRAVFICYTRADNKNDDPNRRWMDVFQKFLKPFVRQEDFTVCSDKDIKIGDDWHEHIQAHLAGAKAAVLLVSADFLASDYITNSELPVLLKNAADKGVKILSIILSPCSFDKARFKYPDAETGPHELMLSRFQAANSPDDPIVDMDEGDQSRVFKKVAEQLAELLNPNP